MKWRNSVIVEDDLDEPIKVDCINAIKELDFSECEELGVNTPKKCNRYLNCQTCTITEEGRTIQEQFELDLMKQNIWWDEDVSLPGQQVAGDPESNLLEKVTQQERCPDCPQ